MSLFLFGISIGEIVLISLVVLMLFGSKKIPDLARALGKGMNEFRRAREDIKREFEESTGEIKRELSVLENEVLQNSNEIRSFSEDTYSNDYGTHKSVTNDIYGLYKEGSPDTNQFDQPDEVVPGSVEEIEPEQIARKSESSGSPG